MNTISKQKPMLASVLQPSFLSALQSLRHAVDTNPALPVLSHVLMQGAGHRLTLSATNLSVTQQVRIDARVETDDFRMISPYKTLLELVKLLDKKRIDLAVYEVDVLTVKQGQYVSRLFTADVEDFPSMKSFAPETATQLADVHDVKTLKNGVKHIASFCELPSSKHRGVTSAYEFLKLSFDSSGLTIIGASRHAMSSTHMPMDVQATMDAMDVYVAPKDFDKAIAVMAKDEAFAMYLTADEETLVLTNGKTTVLLDLQTELTFDTPTPHFSTIATCEVQYAQVASVLKLAKFNKVLHLGIGTDCITFSDAKDAHSRQVAVPVPIQWTQVTPIDTVMLPRNLKLNLSLEATLQAFERGLRWRKGTKKHPCTAKLHLMLDSRTDEVVIGLSGRDAQDFYSVDVALDKQGQRWHSYKAMRELRQRYADNQVALQAVPSRYRRLEVNWFDVPQNLKDIREVKIAQHNIQRDIVQFVGNYPCWSLGDMMVVSATSDQRHEIWQN